MSFHEEIELLIKGKLAKVDKNIFPVVKWLNEFESVKTLFSCEGVLGSDIHLPYVLFTCEDPKELKIILNSVNVIISDTDILELARVSIDSPPWIDGFRYWLRFHSVKNRVAFVRKLHNKNFDLTLIDITEVF